MPFMPASSGREWNAGEYHRLSNPQVEWGRKLLDRLLLRGDEAVLDAGCGTGRLTRELLERLPRGRVVGVDLSQNMVDAAREHVSDPRATILRADLQELTFDAQFDGVFSTATFHWVPDHHSLMRGLLRALKPGGWLEAQCGGGPNLERLFRRARVIMDCAEYRPCFAGWQKPTQDVVDQTMAATMRRAGFLEVRCWLEPAPAVLRDAQEFKDYLATVTLHPYLERIADAALRQRFLEELAGHAGQDSPPFEMDYWRLNMSARKAQ